MKGSNSNVPYIFLTAGSICRVTENTKVVGEIMKEQRLNMIFFEVSMNFL